MTPRGGYFAYVYRRERGLYEWYDSPTEIAAPLPLLPHLLFLIHLQYNFQGDTSEAPIASEKDLR